ncbi:MAG TPA: cupredoxin family copper-binding protein [Dongiaceae bacterium]
MKRLRFLLSPLVLTAAVAILAANVFLVFGNLSHRDAAAAEMPGVTIDNYQFAPATLTIAVGSSITWTNNDSDIHSVAADDGDPVMFKSAGLDTDDKFSFTFTKPGTYLYHCTLHPHMTGKIVVQ